MCAPKPLIIYGAGDHGLVVAQAAAAAGWNVVGFLDNQPPASHLHAIPIYQTIPQGVPQENFFVAIGDNMARRRLYGDLAQDDTQLVNVIHPTAWVSPTAILGSGIYVGPQAVINTDAEIGNGVIVNSGATVEHHCVVGPFAHLAPGVAMGGHVWIGALTLVGVGASIRPQVRIGEHCTVGVGAAVVNDLADNRTATGVPAQPK